MHVKGGFLCVICRKWKFMLDAVKNEGVSEVSLSFCISMILEVKEKISREKSRSGKKEKNKEWKYFYLVKIFQLKIFRSSMNF
jgi:hypothetical protein